MASSYYPSNFPNSSISYPNSSNSSPNPLISSIYPQSYQSLEMKAVPDYPVYSEFTTSGIRAVDSAAANMRTLTESEEISIRVELLESALAEISRVLGDCKTKPSPEFLAGWKDYLATEVMNLLLLERWMSESVDQNEKFNSAENFELVGSVLIEKVIDEKLEGIPIDSSSEANFFQKSTDEGKYRSKPEINFSNAFEASPAVEIQGNDSQVVNLISLRFDLEEKMKTCFLDYQEGKPFSNWPELINDVCLQFEKALYVMNSNRTVPLSTVEMCYEQFKGQGFLIVSNNKVLMKKILTHHILFGLSGNIHTTIQLAKPQGFYCDQIKRIADYEVRNFNSGNQIFSVKFLEPITESNSTQLFLHTIRIAKVYLFIYISLNTFMSVISLDNYTRLVFDRGREFKVFRRYSYYVSISSKFFVGIAGSVVLVLNRLRLLLKTYTNFVYRVIIKLGYGLELLFETWNSFSLVKSGDILNVCNLFEKIWQHVTILWSSHSTSFDASCSILIRILDKYTRIIDLGSVLMCASSEECSFDILVFARRIFDRGRLLELLMRSTKFCLSTLTYGVLSLTGSTGITKYNGNMVYEISLTHGNCSELLWEYSAFVFLSNGDRQVVCKFLEETLQLVIGLCAKLIIQGTRQRGFNLLVFLHVFVFTWFPFKLKSTRNSCCYILVLLEPVGLSDLVMCGNSDWSLTWNLNHSLLQLQNTLPVKMERRIEQLQSYYCCKVFKRCEKEIVTAGLMVEALKHKRIIEEIFIHIITGSRKASVMHGFEYHIMEEGLIQYKVETILQHILVSNWWETQYGLMAVQPCFPLSRNLLLESHVNQIGALAEWEVMFGEITGVRYGILLGMLRVQRVVELVEFWNNLSRAFSDIRWTGSASISKIIPTSWEFEVGYEVRIRTVKLVVQGIATLDVMMMGILLASLVTFFFSFFWSYEIYPQTVRDLSSDRKFAWIGNFDKRYNTSVGHFIETEGSANRIQPTNAAHEIWIASVDPRKMKYTLTSYNSISKFDLLASNKETSLLPVRIRLRLQLHMPGYYKRINMKINIQPSTSNEESIVTGNYTTNYTIIFDEICGYDGIVTKMGPCSSLEKDQWVVSFDLNFSRVTFTFATSCTMQVQQQCLSLTELSSYFSSLRTRTIWRSGYLSCTWVRIYMVVYCYQKGSLGT